MRETAWKARALRASFRSMTDLPAPGMFSGVFHVEG
jgi:hypothetical protein